MLSTQNILKSLVLTSMLSLMIFFGIKAYNHALSFERYTTELVSFQGVEDLTKRKLHRLAKSILGDFYDDEHLAHFDKIKALKKYATQEAHRYTYYFMATLLLLLLMYFFTSLRLFTAFGALAAMITLFFGLVAPILMVTIHKEVEYLGDVVLSFESKGVVGSIVKLWDNGDFVVAGVILAFSVIIPVVKIVSLLFVSVFVESKFAHTVVKFFKMIGKWSMVDVFVVAVFLVYLTANKGDVSRAEVEVGLYFFLAYVIVSMLVSLSADKMLQR